MNPDEYFFANDDGLDYLEVVSADDEYICTVDPGDSVQDILDKILNWEMNG